MEPLLKFEHVTICYNGENVVQDINLELNRGEILGVVGESGSGKSTIIKAVMGLLGNEGMVTEGHAQFEGKDLFAMGEKELDQIRGNRIAMIFQDSGAALCPIRTVGDQIYESLREHEKISRHECDRRALEMMAKIGLKDGGRVLKSYPFELSGGMNQRVGICISMLQNPSLLLADEPTGNLDPTNSWEIMKLLEEANDRGTTVLVVTHNQEIVNEMQKRVVTMKKGVIVSDEKKGGYNNEN